MKLILPTAIAPEIAPHLPAIAPDLVVVHIDDLGTPDGDLSDAEAMIRWWTPPAILERILDAAPQVRWIHTPSAGVDGFLSPKLKQRGMTITNAAGVHAIPIAEFVLMAMLAHAKRASALLALAPDTAWQVGDTLKLDELHEKTLLIVGLGHIGEEIARRAAGFGMRVLGSRRRPRPTAHVEQVVGQDEWRTLLPQADYIAIAAPLTDATRGMIDAAAFAQMRPNAYLINIARGQIIDTDALLAALDQHQIAGAALDALPEEPLPPNHPLWCAPNVWITPHISWSSPRMRRRSAEVFLENLRRYQAGEPLINQVDMEAGY